MIDAMLETDFMGKNGHLGDIAAGGHLVSTLAQCHSHHTDILQVILWLILSGSQ